MKKNNINKEVEHERLKLLSNFLKNAPFDGWSKDNLQKSAEQAGLSLGYTRLIFPNEIKGLVLYFNKLINKQMEEIFLKTNKFEKISDKIAYLIETRFALYLKNKEAIQKLLQYNMLPQNFLFSQKLLWSTCDEIWFLAGDQSTDFNYYSKRALLAYVYSNSVLFWLSDDSKNFNDTKHFIRKKIAQVLKIGGLKARGLSFLKSLCARS